MKVFMYRNWKNDTCKISVTRSPCIQSNWFIIIYLTIYIVGYSSDDDVADIQGVFFK